MSTSGLQDHPEWGAYTLQMEIRSDGTVLQVADYCQGEDWSYEARWELQDDGALRILPAEGDELLPFQHWATEYKYVDIQPAEGACTATVVRTAASGDSETNTEIERGRWCIGDYIAEFDECEMQIDCGEDPPVCE